VAASQTGAPATRFCMILKTDTLEKTFLLATSCHFLPPLNPRFVTHRQPPLLPSAWPPFEATREATSRQQTASSRQRAGAKSQERSPSSKVPLQFQLQFQAKFLERQCWVSMIMITTTTIIIIIIPLCLRSPIWAPLLAADLGHSSSLA